MDKVLDNGDIALLKYSFLKELVSSGELLQKRQDMPSHAFGDWSKANQIFSVVYVRQGESGTGHRDPNGVTLKEIVRKLDNLGVDDTTLVFWNWSSLYQDPRSQVQEAANQRAMHAITSTAGTCSGIRFKVLVLTQPGFNGMRLH